MRIVHIVALIARGSLAGLYGAKEVYSQSACLKAKAYFAERNWEGDVSCSAMLVPFGMALHVRAEKLDLQEADFAKMNWSGAEVWFNAPVEVYFGQDCPLQPEFIVRKNGAGVFVKEDFPPSAS